MPPERRREPMLRVGLTGGAGSGKSTIARMFQSRGAHVIDADELARLVVQPGRPALEDIAKEFGAKVLRPDGTLNRPALGRIIFSDAEARARLNAIIHPQIWAEEERLFRDLEAQDPEGVVVLDAALLIEAGGVDRMDVVVVVDVDEETQIGRLVRQKGLSPSEARARLSAQLSTAQKASFADHVVDNRDSLEATERQVEAIWAGLLEKARKKRLTGG